MKRDLLCTLASLSLAGLAPPAAAQERAPQVQQAWTAYNELRYSDAIRAARAAVRGRLAHEDQVAAYEVLAYALAALDSTARAVEAFKQLIFLDPDREPDVNDVAPRIVNAYTAALGDVLVVRRAALERTSFVAGEGDTPIRFEVSRPSRAIVRVVGPQGYDVVVDSFLVARQGGAAWSALTPDGDPAPEGSYQVIVTAVERGNQHGAELQAVVTHAPVDTLAHLLGLPGQTPLPEMERPPRDWRPLGLSLLYAGVGAGATLALDQPSLNSGPQAIVTGVSVVALISGFVSSIRRPDPQPVVANIRYNLLLRDELARRNEEIARQNAERRRQIRITITPVTAEAEDR